MSYTASTCSYTASTCSSTAATMAFDLSDGVRLTSQDFCPNRFFRVEQGIFVMLEFLSMLSALCCQTLVASNCQGVHFMARFDVPVDSRITQQRQGSISVVSYACPYQRCLFTSILNIDINSINLQQLYNHLCVAFGACPYQRCLSITILVINIHSVCLYALNYFFDSR